MNSFIWFLIGFLVGVLVFWCYSWVTDKINLLKLGYNGGSWLVKLIINKFNSKQL